MLYDWSFIKFKQLLDGLAVFLGIEGSNVLVMQSCRREDYYTYSYLSLWILHRNLRHPETETAAAALGFSPPGHEETSYDALQLCQPLTCLPLCTIDASSIDPTFKNAG